MENQGILSVYLKFFIFQVVDERYAFIMRSKPAESGKKSGKSER